MEYIHNKVVHKSLQLVFYLTFGLLLFECQCRTQTTTSRARDRIAEFLVAMKNQYTIPFVVLIYRRLRRMILLDIAGLKLTPDSQVTIKTKPRV